MMRRCGWWLVNGKVLVDGWWARTWDIAAKSWARVMEQSAGIASGDAIDGEIAIREEYNGFDDWWRVPLIATKS